LQLLNATSSSHDGSLLPSKALDGFEWWDEQRSKSCFVSKVEADPYWRADLEQEFIVEVVVIHSRRAASDKYNLNNVQVHVFQRNEKSLCAVGPENVSDRIRLVCGDLGLIGDAVEVSLIGNDKSLFLCEVEVFGQVIQDSRFHFLGFGSCCHINYENIGGKFIISVNDVQSCESVCSDSIYCHAFEWDNVGRCFHYQNLGDGFTVCGMKAQCFVKINIVHVTRTPYAATTPLLKAGSSFHGD
jgi:hypothetical protein